MWWVEFCSGFLEGRLQGSVDTPHLFSVEGISVKMFLRGRPITMYIPSGIRSLEELPSGPPPETLSLDWVYPAPSSPLGTNFMRNPLYGFLLCLWGQGAL